MGLTFEEALRRIYLGRSIAFMGAGFSAGIPAVEGEIPYAGDFADELGKAANEDPGLPLDLAASVYEREKIEPPLRVLIPRRFTAKDAPDAHRKIASLPWRRIYTTNYDNVIELARAKDGLSRATATAHDHPVHYAHEFTIVHLHGFVERITPHDWDEAYVLTNEQYASDILRDSGWIEMFRNDVQYADSIVFFGYSVGDIDIARLLYENPSLKNKTFFAIGEHPSRSVEIRTSPFGESLKLSTERVADLIPSADDPAVPKPSPFLSALTRVTFNAAPTAPSRDHVVELLVKGNTRPEYIARDLINGTHEYYVSRDAINEKSSDVGKPALRWFIHGGLGEGKTHALSELAHFFLAENYEVLSLDGDLDGFANDIDYLSSLDSEAQAKVIVFIESAFSYDTEVRALIERFPLVSIVATNRSAALQTRIGDVKEALGDDFEFIDLNGLTEDEISDFDDLLFANGLWGERQGLPKAKRQELIANTYRGSLSSVLLDVCRSTDLYKRVSDLFAEIDGRVSDMKKAIVVSLGLAYAGSRVTIGQLSEIAQTDIFKFGTTQTDPIVREFFDIEKNRIAVRSPAFAQAVLKEAVSDALLIELYPEIIARMDRLRQDNRSYDEPVKQMMRFGFIERVLVDDNEKERKLVSYFENIRSSGVGIANPQFWLQYAIACMSFENYEDAESHFDSAFGLARRKGGYDPYQIENTYARFLLESRSRTNKWDDYAEAFSKAHEIIVRQMSSVREGYYPYRVARLYLEFVDARLGTMDRTQKERVAEGCSQLLQLSEKAPAVVRRSIYWRDAREALKAAGDIVAEAL